MVRDTKNLMRTSIAKPFRRYLILLFALWILALLPITYSSSCFSADTAASVDPGTLRVAMDDNYPPYIFRDSSGALTGYLIDVWQLWEKKTGVHVEILATDWDKAKANRSEEHTSE